MPQQKINILHLRDSPWVDGPGRTILETASLIDKTKYNYIIGAFAGPDWNSNPLIEAAISRNLKVFPIKEKKSFDFDTIRQIIDYIDKNNIHILHSHETRSDLIGLICAKKKHIRLVTTLHGWITNDLKSKVLAYLDKVILHFFYMIIVVSERMKQQVMKYKIPEKKIHVLRNSLLVDQYHPDSEDQNFRKEFNIPPETVLIGNIGRLSPEKGQVHFILAANEILKKNYNVKFVLIGIGSDQEKLQKLARENSISDSVIFTGYRSDMQSIYNSLDLVVQSSFTEGMPNVILESLLMETPVIATDVGGTSEIVEDNTTGILIKPGDFRTISIKIEQYLKNTNFFHKITEIGNKRVKEEFNFHWRTKKLSKLYDGLYSGPRK